MVIPIIKKEDNKGIINIPIIEKEDMLIKTRLKTLCEYTDDEIKELKDDEIIKLIYGKYKPLLAELQNHDMQHPLIQIREGYRLYDNNKDWNCNFCGEVIRYKTGYWGPVYMQWNQGTKLCHRCFLKFLIMMEENWGLRGLFEMLYEKEKKDRKSLPNPLDRLSI
jgi:hypothetical protein